MSEKNHELDLTLKFSLPTEEKNTAEGILLGVYESLSEKGYNPVHQMIGYLLSGDPTYITSYNDARSKIIKMERDELMEELLVFYLKSRGVYQK